MGSTVKRKAPPITGIEPSTSKIGLVVLCSDLGIPGYFVSHKVVRIGSKITIDEFKKK
jgi:hypothetical protein